jgi:GMP synthase-like glutamine amidotransferase
MVKLLAIQHIECEHLGTFSDYFIERRIDFEYLKLFEGESFPNPMSYDGVIILGGPMNAYEETEYPFLVNENSFIKESMKICKPVLGICLGAQLIAKASGAKVYTGECKEIGWSKIFLTEEGRFDEKMNVLGRELLVFQWHNDTFNIPNLAKRLAASDLFRNQAFSIGSSCYALQFHLEVTFEMVASWLKIYEDDLKTLNDGFNPEIILRLSKKNIKNLNSKARLFCSKFLDFLR